MYAKRHTHSKNEADAISATVHLRGGARNALFHGSAATLISHLL